jgi:LysR family glycine cleavage system transcriptional activator
MLEPRLPSLASIRAFEAAARLGGFAGAAAELGTTSAAVSYHVRQLERQIGIALFERHARGVTLTRGGAEIAGETSRFFAALHATFVKARDTREHHLSLTALPTFGTSWLTPRLGRFRANHHNIIVELELSQDAQRLGTGRFDAAIRNGLGDWPGLRSILLFPSLCMPLCSPNLKDAARGIGDPLRDLPVPLLGRPDWWQLWYEAAGFAGVDLKGRFGTALAAEHLDAAAAISGQGVTIGSPILFADEIAAGRLVPAHDLIASVGRSFWFVYPLMHGQSRKITLFRHWLQAEVEQTLSFISSWGLRLELARGN